VARARAAFQETKGAALQHSISAFQEARAAIRRGLPGAHESKQAMFRGRSGAQEARRRLGPLAAGVQEARGRVAHGMGAAQETRVRVSRAVAGFQEQVRHFIASARRGAHEALAQSHTFRATVGAQEAKGTAKPRRTGWLEALFAPFIPVASLPPEVHEIDQNVRPIPKAPSRPEIDAPGRPAASPGIIARLRRIMAPRRGA